ncbi:hypothetical protein [Hufsiella ginkgonis]|uniref:Uncharacterized protein n=1 Tax=Hufsiella ginkgonis TaxID=2695274 RepID=A0A7K1XZ06_9SPHI|nr:hypothetical protein [Hufsiella ginkgonis]MXV16234.1 hypothetical protein [Hufsiella ginkgonis]
MSVTYTQHTLDKLEELFKQLGFKVRYERGNFRTGACMLESSQIVVVNKFSNVESRINSLIELLQQLSVAEEILDEKHKQFLYSLKQTELKL